MFIIYTPSLSRICPLTLSSSPDSSSEPEISPSSVLKKKKNNEVKSNHMCELKFKRYMDMDYLYIQYMHYLSSSQLFVVTLPFFFYFLYHINHLQ